MFPRFAVVLDGCLGEWGPTVTDTDPSDSSAKIWGKEERWGVASGCSKYLEGKKSLEE